METKYIHQAWEVSAQAPGGLDGITPETFKESVEKARIGADYLIDRKKVEREYQKRFKTLMSAPEPKSFREPRRKG